MSYSELLAKLDAAGLSKRSEKVWNQIMGEADANGDNILTLTEFVDIMRQYVQ